MDSVRVVLAGPSPTFQNNAVVTLVTGHNSGYAYGAVSLGESLKLHRSKLHRVAMVTPDVDVESRQLIELLWDIVDVDPIYCHDRSAHLPAGVLPSTKQGYGEGLRQDMKRFETTCTKFHAWTFMEYDRILFMDSDLVVLDSIDDAIYEYSNASFVAAPECFPPDTINSGFMVFTPSLDTFAFLVEMNENHGSAEGGDQGIYSVYLCPDWFFSDRSDKKCGKLPWKYNVEAQYYLLYKNYLALYQMDKMKVIHYINDGKPWKTLFFDYNIDSLPRTSMIEQLSADSYVESHMYWRYLFLRATGLPPPKRSIYYETWDDVINRRGIFKSIDLPLFPGDESITGFGGETVEVSSDGIILQNFQKSPSPSENLNQQQSLGKAKPKKRRKPSSRRRNEDVMIKKNINDGPIGKARENKSRKKTKRVNSGP